MLVVLTRLLSVLICLSVPVTSLGAQTTASIPGTIYFADGTSVRFLDAGTGGFTVQYQNSSRAVRYADLQNLRIDSYELKSIMEVGSLYRFVVAPDLELTTKTGAVLQVNAARLQSFCPKIRDDISGQIKQQCFGYARHDGQQTVLNIRSIQFGL